MQRNAPHRRRRTLNSTIREIAEGILSGHEEPAVLQAYRKALESHDAPIVIVDAEGTIRFLNRAACVMTHNESSESIVGTHVDDAGFAWHADGKSPSERLAQGESSTYFELDGRSFTCEAVVLRDRLNVGIGVLECIRPEGDWVLNEGINPITGIADKSRFVAKTRRLLDCNPDKRYAIVFWGVIRFKLINDVFSPSTGERVLKSIADTISSFTADEGTCGHFDNDSFVLCMPWDRLSTEWFKRHSEVTLISDTAMYTFKSTYGVYKIFDRSCSVETMCERAALAQSTVIESHTAEDDCYAFYDKAMHENVVENQALVSQLSYALASNQVQVYYQPIYDIRTGQIASAEALARWVHPENGVVMPGRFIPLFESNGMITELDKHIWDHVATFLEQRLAAGLRTLPISTNVSRVDFFATTLMDDFDEIVNSHHLPRKLIRIEVTESAYTDNPERIVKIMDTLRERGHTVLLDDFGSGYSSLNTLKDLPIDILKLDMSFLRDFETDSRTKAIINHIVAMAHDLGLKVVAEGVETQEQVDFLRSVDCHLAQGYFYARPLPEESFVELLDKADSEEQ